MVIKTVVIKNPKDLPPVDKKMMKKIKSLKNRDIDLTDILPLTSDSLNKMIPIKLLHHSLYRPVKKTIKINCDVDVLEWFKMLGKGYQTKMNLVLRQYMLSHLLRSK